MGAPQSPHRSRASENVLRQSGIKPVLFSMTQAVDLLQNDRQCHVFDENVPDNSWQKQNPSFGCLSIPGYHSNMIEPHFCINGEGRASMFTYDGLLLRILIFIILTNPYDITPWLPLQAISYISCGRAFCLLVIKLWHLSKCVCVVL